MEKQERMGYIDGMKGIASMLVVFTHLVTAFLPGLLRAIPTNGPMEKLWLDSPLNCLTNGAFPVQFFLVISGFLTARKQYRRAESPLYQPVRAYGRLLRIVMPAVFFAYVLMKLGWMRHMDVLAVNEALINLRDYNQFTPTLSGMLFDGMVLTFLKESLYVSPLWTIHLEFIGVFMITLIASYSAKREPRPRVYYLLMGLFLVRTNEYGLYAFLFGALAFDCIDRLETDHSRLGQASRFLLTRKTPRALTTVAALYLACINTNCTGLWDVFYPLINYSGLLRGVGVTVLVMLVATSPRCQRFFGAKPLVGLGRLSAYTYAFHWPIILSLGCWLYLALYTRLAYLPMIAVISVVCIGATLAMAFGYLKLSEAVSRRVGKLAFPQKGSLGG